MKDHDEIFGAIAIVTLLIVTAFGNAIVMLITSLIGLLAGFLFYQKDLFRGHARIATVGFIAAAVLSFLIALVGGKN